MKLKREQLKDFRIIIACFYIGFFFSVVGTLIDVSHPVGSMCEYTGPVELDIQDSLIHHRETEVIIAPCSQPSIGGFLLLGLGLTAMCLITYGSGKQSD